uniref:Putative zc3h12a-like ribonuclease nyn domain protein n=1 Tax=Culex tarsalis TaxID=7177 RepID=A0A1Q3G017_CULTA
MTSNSRISRAPRAQIQNPIRRRQTRRNRHIRTIIPRTNRAQALPHQNPAQLRTVRPNSQLILVAAGRARRSIQQDHDIPPERRRPVLCDGESLAYDEVSGRFDAARVEAGVRWFEAIGHRTVAVVPRDLRGKATNAYALDNLQNEGRLVVVECSGGSPEENQELEKVLLERAVGEEGVVISEREFRQVYSNYPDVRSVVVGRVVGFCFFKGAIFIPVDPYGRNRPDLKAILSNLRAPVLNLIFTL